MTTFIDGPAKGQTLMLRRCPIFVRVVRNGDKWDALDQPSDEMEAGDKAYAYQLKEQSGHVHLNCGGKSKNASGFYPMAKYEICLRQPLQSVMKINSEWINYCKSLPKSEIPKII